MDQVFFGLWNVYEHARDKLERVDRLAVVNIVSGFGLINEEPRFRMITKSGQIHWGALRLELAFIEQVPGAANEPHRIIQGAGHFLQEDHPDEFTQAVLDLLRRLDPPDRSVP